jgi:uncharacterized membrane protein YfhO
MYTTYYNKVKGRSLEDLLKDQNAMQNFDSWLQRYFKPKVFVLKNEQSFGNAWFVSKVKLVGSANEEMKALEGVTKEIAFVRESFADQLPKTIVKDSTDTIYLEEYLPNHLTYISKTKTEQLAIFSEIYYDKGWNAFIDGRKVDYIRANYLLRGLKVPAGDHKIEFKFEPETYFLGSTLSYIGSSIVILFILGVLVYEYYFRRKKQGIEVAENTTEG